MIEVTSADLQAGGTVPARFTCDGEDAVPALAWSGLPDGTLEVVVVVDDPDAPRGTFTHWTVWGLAPGDTPLGSPLPEHAVEGRTSFGRVGYGGPCPPRGDQPHRYRFRVFAMGVGVDLPGGASPDDLAAAMEDHVLGLGELEVTYGR